MLSLDFLIPMGPSLAHIYTSNFPTSSHHTQTTQQLIQTCVCTVLLRTSSLSPVFKVLVALHGTKSIPLESQEIFIHGTWPGWHCKRAFNVSGPVGILSVNPTWKCLLCHGTGMVKFQDLRNLEHVRIQADHISYYISCILNFLSYFTRCLCRQQICVYCLFFGSGGFVRTLVVYGTV